MPGRLETGGRTFDSQHVYFAFCSGTLAYDCVQCGALCCRGHGYCVEPGKAWAAQVAMQPLIAFFAHMQDGAGTNPRYVVRNQKPGCFFLTGDGLCGIHRDHGLAGKPGTCRLFPFNNIKEVAGYLVVAPHRGLCPLEVVKPGVYSQLSDHAELFTAMAAGVDTDIARAVPIATDVDVLVGLERDIAGEARDRMWSGDYAGFVERQVELTLRARGVSSGGQLGHDDYSVDEHYRHMWLMLGIVPAPSLLHDVGIVAALVASTPAIRADIVFRVDQDGRTATRLAELGRLPRLCAALHVLTTLTAMTGVRTVTYQTIQGLMKSHHAFLWMLALVDEVVEWRRDAVVNSWDSGDEQSRRLYLNLVRALLPSYQSRARARLGEVVAKCLPDGLSDRALFLRAVAPRIVDGLEGTEKRARRRWSRTSVRAAIQHWAISRLPR
jgi:Fe-S-cluster containining protein